MCNMCPKQCLSLNDNKVVYSETIDNSVYHIISKSLNRYLSEGFLTLESWIYLLQGVDNLEIDTQSGIIINQPMGCIDRGVQELQCSGKGRTSWALVCAEIFLVHTLAEFMAPLKNPLFLQKYCIYIKEPYVFHTQALLSLEHIFVEYISEEQRK